MSAFRMTDEMSAILAREYAKLDEQWHRENQLLAVAAAGGPFWGVGKIPAKPAEFRGLAEFLPRPRGGR